SVVAAQELPAIEDEEPDHSSSRPVLPMPLTSFIGRASERQALGDLLKRERLVTTLGPGGVGKTRLAATVAAEIADDFEGVWFVDLVPVTDAAMIPASVTTALGVAEHPSRSLADALATWIGDRRLLVVLDNCEHLVDGAAVFVEQLLTDCPQLVILA